MRWSSKISSQYPVPSSQRKVGHWVLSTGYWVLLATVTLLSAAPSADEKHISVYSPVATYTLPVLDRAGREYVGLLELLEPLGRVSSESDGRRWRLRYNAIEAEFSAGKTRAKIRGRDFDFMAPFLVENSRGLVPLNSLGELLPRFLGTPVNFREGARRLFVGAVGIQIGFQLDASDPPRLALNFSGPVNPTISTEPGKLRMVFKRDPVVSPGSQIISFANQVITLASYSESNGDAELDVAATEPLMASFTNDRRTIVVSAVPQTPATPSGAPPQNPAQAANIASGTHRVLAVVDPAHGGDERGAALTDTLAEKDVTLGFSRLLRHELEIRGFAVALLRDSDTSLTLDQRAAAANVARAGIYISLHAVSQGSGARVYTALLPVEGTSNGVFHAWNAAQAPVLPVSKIVSAAIVAEMQKREFPVRASSASLRPLNNVLMPAVAVELAPGADGVADLTSASYQQRAASAIADAVVSVRDRLGVQP
jgi:N-acetylmuramoyl-L-alanine amidase